MQTHKNQFESANGFQPSSLLHLYEDLKEAGVFYDYNLECFTLNGGTRSKKKKSFYGLLAKPNERFFNELQDWCQNNGVDIEGFDKTFYETEGTPLMILHDVRRIRSKWYENLRCYIMNIMKKSQEFNYQYSETVFEAWKDKDQVQVNREFIILLELLDNTVYIHEGYRFPTYNPKIINKGKKFSTHLIDIDGYYWPVEIHFASRSTIKKFYDYPLNRRYKFSLKLNQIGLAITICEELSETVSSIPENNEMFGTLEKVNCDRQEALLLDNYTNTYLGFESLKKVIPISYLEQQNINLIPVFPTKIYGQGILGSYFFKNGQFKVQILVTNKKGEWTGNLRKKNYNEVVSQFQDEHLILCPTCKKYLLTNMMKNQHRLTCEQNQKGSLTGLIGFGQLQQALKQPQQLIPQKAETQKVIEGNGIQKNLFANNQDTEKKNDEQNKIPNPNNLFTPLFQSPPSNLFSTPNISIFGKNVLPTNPNSQNQEIQQNSLFLDGQQKQNIGNLFLPQYPPPQQQQFSQIIFKNPIPENQTPQIDTDSPLLSEKPEETSFGDLCDQKPD